MPSEPQCEDYCDDEVKVGECTAIGDALMMYGATDAQASSFQQASWILDADVAEECALGALSSTPEAYVVPDNCPATAFATRGSDASTAVYTSVYLMHEGVVVWLNISPSRGTGVPEEVGQIVGAACAKLVADQPQS